MDAFLNYMKPVLTVEGSYSNNKADTGGATKYGITEARARAAGYNGDMHDLDLDTALHIYRLFYWEQPMFDQLDLILPRLASMCLDYGINMGQRWPGFFLQRSLNVLNREGTDFPDITVDGMTGAMTRAALRSLLQKRGNDEGGKVVTGMVQALATVRYITIAEAKPALETFEYGWQRNRSFRDRETSV